MAVQYDDLRHPRWRRVPEQRSERGLRLRQFEPEGRPLARFGAHADLALHQAGQPAADRQPQSGAAEPAAGAEVALHERLEDFGLLRRAHPDARIGHFDAQATSLGVEHTDPHESALGELDRIADQIEQDLADARGVAGILCPDVGRDIEQQLEAFFGGAESRHIEHRAQHILQCEGNRFDVQPAGFDLGEIEHIVEHDQQASGR